MSEAHDFTDRSFDASVYDREYYEGDGSKSGYKSYMTAKGIVQAQFSMTHRIMRDIFGLDPSHLDVGCAYGFGCMKLKEMGWKSRGVDVSEWAIEKMKKLTDIDAEVADVVDDAYWKKFEDKEVDLITGVEFFEHIESKDVSNLIKNMSRAGKWGFFVVNGRTSPDTDVMSTHGDHGHLNNHNMSWWFSRFAEYGEIDWDRQFEFSKMAEAYNRSVHWHNRCVIIRFE